MRAHDLRTQEDRPDRAVCARCGLLVLYFAGNRNPRMDRAAVDLARRSFMAMAGLKESNLAHYWLVERDRTDCDLIMEASVHVVMRG